MSRPKPTHRIVCDTCDLPWEDHEDTVYAEEDLADPITTATCVKLLKKAHQGPPGPAGPMGPRGAMGDTGRPGKDAAQPYPYTPFSPQPGRLYPPYPTVTNTYTYKAEEEQ